MLFFFLRMMTRATRKRWHGLRKDVDGFWKDVAKKGNCYHRIIWSFFSSYQRTRSVFACKVSFPLGAGEVLFQEAQSVLSWSNNALSLYTVLATTNQYKKQAIAILREFIVYFISLSIPWCNKYDQAGNKSSSCSHFT